LFQWIDGALAKGEEVQFFHDEFRCPIYVKDLVAIILALTSQWISGIGPLLHMLMYKLDIGMLQKNLFINEADFHRLVLRLQNKIRKIDGIVSIPKLNISDV